MPPPEEPNPTPQTPQVPAPTPEECVEPDVIEHPLLKNPLSVMQPGERTLFELKRHPIGIITTYLVTLLIFVVLAVIGLVVLPGLASGGAGQTRALVTVGLVFFTLLAIVFNLVATVIYWGNRWIMTDDSLTQILQTSLFHKETSQLGLESLEDVTADKNGFLASLLNYGVLKAETAGQRSKFVFIFAPKPDYYARQLLEAREKIRVEGQARPTR